MTISQNQFAMAPIQGQLTLQLNTNVIPCQVDSSQVADLVPGQAVKMVDSSGGVPKVIAVASDADDVFGFVDYSIKDASYPAGARVEISAYQDNVMYMTAGAAIARNGQVAVVVASKKVIPAVAASGKRIVGRALDKATADGDLIRVVIMLPGALA